MTRPYILETERLLLRPKTLADLEAMHAVLGDPEVTGYVFGSPRTVEQVGEGLARAIEHQRRYGFSMWALVERASEAVIGDCGLQLLAGPA